jgi:hypothetical protein
VAHFQHGVLHARELASLAEVGDGERVEPTRRGGAVRGELPHGEEDLVKSVEARCRRREARRGGAGRRAPPQGLPRRHQLPLLPTTSDSPPCSPSRKKLRRRPRRHEAAVADAGEAAPSLRAPSPPRPQPRPDDAVPFCEFASPTSVVRYADEVAAPALPAFDFLYGGSASWATLPRRLRRRRRGLAGSGARTAP